jgi:hypothetical protein
MDQVMRAAMRAAGLGLSSGNVVLLRSHGSQSEAVGVAVGHARLSPVVGFHSGAVLLYAHLAY